MDIKGIIAQIKKYSENEFNFSALALWEKIITNDSSEYMKFKYADILRLCGYYSKSLFFFNEINYDKVPFQYLYFIHLNKGTLYMDMGQTELAKEEFSKCFTFNECDTVPYVYFSVLLMRAGNNRDAIDYLEQSLQKEGNIDEVYYNLATNYAILGNYETALYNISKCLEIDPEFPNAIVLKKDLLSLISNAENFSE